MKNDSLSLKFENKVQPYLKTIVAKLDIASYSIVPVNHPFLPIKRNKYFESTQITIQTILKQTNTQTFLCRNQTNIQNDNMLLFSGKTMSPHNVAAPNMLPVSELMLPTAYTKQVTGNTNNVYNLKIDCLSTKY